MKNVYICCLLLLYLIITSACNRRVTTNLEISSPVQTKSIILFIDMMVNESNSDAYNLNKRKLSTILRPIRSKYIDRDDEEILPITIDIFPIFYNTGNSRIISSYSSYIEPGELTDSEKSKAKIRFNMIQKDYNDFYEKHLKNTDLTYKEIWPSLRVLAQEINNKKSKSITVIYYSDFLELHYPEQPNEGRFAFAKPSIGTEYIVCDYAAIQKADDDLKNNSSFLFKQLNHLKNNIKQGIDGKDSKDVEVLLIEAESTTKIKYDDRSTTSVISKIDYWINVFNFIGLNNVKIVTEKRLIENL